MSKYNETATNEYISRMTMDQCRTLLNYRKSHRSFERLLNRVADAGGPTPIDGCFTMDQLRRFVQTWEDVESRERKARKARRGVSK